MDEEGTAGCDDMTDVSLSLATEATETQNLEVVPSEHLPKWRNAQGNILYSFLISSNWFIVYSDDAKTLYEKWYNENNINKQMIPVYIMTLLILFFR